ncbi:hypothetical protein V6259_12960 [Marinomonas sp. TI.3.20]|uniref:hypothetical protein n=1 Tax=Marinomonas sp. TI.3.20 TaxID=3121296 RepID=UPI0031203776
MITSFDEKTTLSDVHFALNYAVLTGKIKQADAPDMLLMGLNTIVKKAKAKDALSDADIHVISFMQHLRSGKVTTRTGMFIRPLMKMLDERVEENRQMNVFFNYIETVEKAHAAWIYSNLPQYFLENPIDGINTKYMKHFRESEITDTSLVISEEQILNNCFSAGYIKSPIEFRLHTPRGDTKTKQKVVDMFDRYGLGHTKPEKVGLANNLQEWAFSIPLKNIDIAHLEASKQVNAKFKEAVEQYATGSAYFVYFENERITTKGFKNQADIQTFLDAIKKEIICLNSAEEPQYLYLSGTLHLMCIKNRQGKTLPLSRFKIAQTQ